LRSLRVSQPCVDRKETQKFKEINSAIKINLNEAATYKNSFKTTAKLSFYVHKKYGKLQNV